MGYIINDLINVLKEKDGYVEKRSGCPTANLYEKVGNYAGSDNWTKYWLDIKNEDTLFLAAIISGLFCFVVGIIFAYKIMLPFMLHFLIGISVGSEITASISVQNYISFLLTIFMIFGIVFELPVISVLLTQMGLLKVEWMKKGRRVIIVVIFLVAALITPPDIVSQVMVAVPMVGLYELSIIICSILMRFRKRDRRS